MSILESIAKTRAGRQLSAQEIDELVLGYSEGSVPDYQMAAWLMAVCCNSLTPQESVDLTSALIKSGKRVDLSSLPGIKIDKHSTGGVGDKITLILLPLLAAVGLTSFKLAGRGLGHTGGTIDKLESIQGLRLDLDNATCLKVASQTGLAICSQTADLVPADKKIYALRDVTATVDSLPLIASSVMSKKIAAGADIILLDVKSGSGAFMKQDEDAIALASLMTRIGEAFGKKVIAVISDMNQPLGYSIGNALEICEVLQLLRDHSDAPSDLLELVLGLGEAALLAASLCEDKPAARSLLMQALENGTAYDKFLQVVAHQEGALDSLLGLEEKLEKVTKLDLLAPASGFIAGIDAHEIGMCAMHLGAGRRYKEDQIDHLVGIKLEKKIGCQVAQSEKLATLYIKSDSDAARDIACRVVDSFSITSNNVAPPQIIKHVF